MTEETKSPLQWIRLELIPLPHCESDYKNMLLWWNPTESLLQGENVELIKQKLDEAMEKGSIMLVSQGSIEITNPYQKPSELAAILGQYFWVIPEPVEAPNLEDNALADNDDSKMILQ
ncbi:hypothetical protein [Thiomicrorhabdus sp. Milos-T2]|uniref:hypothetical protein n=1 Tax=Thiomicrorhabdus sp. Milos-T2 TaxID=90814 RepID=UPI000493D485|nr:hypothetical protein [Thiomicrorhabdus sp. Milos-T2]